MHHGPAEKMGIDHAVKRKTRLGIIFFFIYLLTYGGFVIIGVFNYDLLASNFTGINLALIYGIGLILFAVVLGIAYNFLCSRYEDEMNEKEAEA